MLPVAVGSLLVVGALLVPAVGLYLAFGLLALGAYWYQGAIADAGASSHVFSPITGLEESTNDVARSAFATLARAFWALLAAAALVAPFVIRNGGCSLIGEDRDAGSFPGMLAALAGWAAAPIVLACVNARLRRGPVPAGKAAKSLVRHPFATLLALALIPVGLLAVELFVACLAIEQGVLSLFLGDLFPQPVYEANVSGT